MYFLNEKKIITTVLERKPEIFSENEKAFIDVVFGLNGKREHTEKEIAKDLKITVPRVTKYYKALFNKAKAELYKVDKDPSRNFIESLDLSARAINVLHRYKVIALDDLAKLTKKELRNMRNIGSKTAAEIEEKAAQAGIILKD